MKKIIFIIVCVFFFCSAAFADNAAKEVIADFSDQSIENSGVAGATIKQRLKGTWKDAPGHVGALEPDGQVAADTLIRLPFKGGLSRDGYFLCTAYKYAYLLRLE